MLFREVRAPARSLVLALAASVTGLMGGCEDEAKLASMKAAKAKFERAAAETERRLAEHKLRETQFREIYDYDDICEGKTRSGAAPYVKVPGKASPVVLADLYVRELEPWGTEDASAVQLVVCAKTVETAVAKRCTFEKGYAVDLMDATWLLTVHEATTGRELARERVEATSPTKCPTIDFFTRGEPVKEEIAKVADMDVVRLVTPFQPPDAPPLTVTDDLLREVCSGGVARGAAAYRPEGPNKTSVYIRERGGAYDDPYFNSAIASVRTRWYPARDGESAEASYAPSLVACVRGEPQGKSRTCSFDGGRKLTIHGALYEVDIRAAKTGELLASKAVKVRRQACPWVHNFSKGDDLLSRPKKGEIASLIQDFANPSGGRPKP